MSNYAMFGLLEGLGRGIANTGEAIGKLSLQQAEEQRQMNLLRIKREWDREDKEADRKWMEGYDEKKFNRDQAADLGKETRTNARQDELLAQAKITDDEKAKRDHGYRLEETEASAAATARHRAPTEYDKQMDQLGKMLESGDITKDEYKNKVLGIQKTATFSAKDVADLRMKAVEQATLEIRGKDPLQPITDDEKKAINKRASELFNSAVGPAGGSNANTGLLETSGIELHPKAKADIAVKLAGAAPEQIPGALESLKKKGLSPEQIAEIRQDAEAIRAKKITAQEKAEEEKKKGLETAQKGQGLLSEGAYRLLNGIPADKPTLDSVDESKLTHNQRRDRQSFSKSAPWLQ